VETLSDSVLMGRVQAGETAQLALLFERYHLALFRYLLHLTGSRSLTEDLVQECFLRVLKYAASYDSSFAFQVWLYRMARNVYFDARHKRRFEVPDTEIREIRSPEPIAEDILAQKEDSALLQEALAKLPEDKREVLVLSRFHDLGYEDIAALLKCEIGTVRVRVYRALKELREKFCEIRGERLYGV